jgi:hypothetical protein
MKPYIAWNIAAFVALLIPGPVFAADLKDEIKVEVDSTAMDPHMKPGTFVCAAGHFHIKGIVQNMAAVPVGPVKVAGKVFDGDGKLLGTATASTKAAVLNPNEKAPVNLEFLSVTGPLIEKVKNQEVTVVAVAPKP